MKQRFFERIGMWLTPPHLRKSKTVHRASCIVHQSQTSLKALTFLLVMLMSVNVWAKEGDVLAEVQGTGNGYGRQTTTDSYKVGWVTIGQSGYFGINSAANNTGAKAGVNATDLPVAKAVNASATSSTSTESNSCTGYYTFYTTTALENVGSIEFYYSANSGNSDATAYVVMGDVKSASGGAAYVQVPLATSSASKQGVSLGTSGTFTFTFAETQKDAKYYGVVIATSSYKRMTGGKITIKEGAGDTPAAELVSIAISGTPKTTYEAGEEFDYSGLVVTGTYSKGDPEAITSGITWEVTPSGALTVSTKSVKVKATVDGKSDTKEYSVTVNEHQVTPGTYDIALNNAFWGTTYSGTISSVSANSLNLNGKQNDVAINLKNGTSTNGYITNDQTRAYNGYSLKFTAPTGYNLTSIVFTQVSGKDWKGTLSADNGTMGTDNKTWDGSSNDVTISFSGTCVIEKVTVTYSAPIKKTVTISTIDAATLKVNNQTGTISDVLKGTSMTLSYSQTEEQQNRYRFASWNVTTEDGAVTVTDNTFKMPEKDVTVSANFTKLYKIEAATVTGGTLSWEDANHAKPTYVEVGTLIQALESEATHYEFKSFDIYKTGDNSTKVEDAEGLFEMPAYDVTISGTFEEMQCTALPSAPVLGTPDISYADGVTLNWSKLDVASGYVINVWKGSTKVVEDEMIEDVNTLSYKITATMDVNTEYSYSIAGLGDDVTYCMLGNPESQATFTTADYPAATLTLSENGTPREVIGLKINTPFNLPDCDVTCDKVFVGWSLSNTDYSNLMAAGASYTMTATTGTLYAWFATETPGTTTWNKVPTNYTDWIGNEFLIVYESSEAQGYVMKSEDAVSNYVEATIASGVIASKPEGAMSVIIEKFGTTDNYQLKVAGATPASYIKGASGNGLSFDASAQQTTISYDNTNGWLISNNSSWLRYNTTDKQTRFRFYKSGTYTQSSYKTVQFYKKTANAPSYSDYSLTCSAKANAPVFSLEEDTYTTAQTLTITAEDGATIYYTTDGTTPDNTKTPYTGAISLNTYGKVTVKAIAYVAEKDPSDVVTKEYMMNLPFTSLEQLVAADVESGTEVTITFPKTQIKSLAGTKGVYFNIQKEDKDIEIYCNSTDFSNTWEAGGYLSATNLTCKWTRYVKNNVFQCWELTPSDWSAFEYSDPDPFTSVADLYAAGLVDGAKVYLNITNAYVHAKTFTTPNNFVYVQDGGVGIVLRTSETIAEENIGKLMTAKIVGNLAYSNGRPQIAVTSMSEVSYTAGDRPAADVTTLSASEEASQILSLVKIDGYYAQSQDKQAKTAVITENANGTGASYTIYNLFGALKTVPESDKAINVKGLFYKKVESNVTSYSIVPVLVEDVALFTAADATLPTLNIEGGATQAEPVSVGLNEIITITPAAGFTAYYKVNDASEWTEITKQVESVTLTVDTKLEVKSTRDYYTDATATYYYKIDGSLTKYAITIPSLSKTRGSVVVTLNDETAASALAGETLTITISNIAEHFHLNSVSVVKSDDNTQTAAEVVSVSEGVYTFEMPECNVDIKVTYGEEPKYSITYQKGGIQAEGEDIKEVAQYAGTVLTLKECTWTSDNYIFKGWKAQYNDGEKDVELPITNNTITVPAYDVKIIATWNKIASYDWVLVTDANQLAAGDYVVIASNAQGKVASSTISDGNMGEVAATFSAEKDYLNSVPTGAAVLTLGGTASAWALSDKDGHKLGATAVKKVAWDGQNATNTWTISISDNNATIASTNSDYGRFLHNSQYTRFTTYGTSTKPDANMLLPQLYKAVEHTYVVKYNLNGGSSKPADSHADADGKVTITTDVPTYTGYKFLGWNSEQEGTGQEYIGGQEYTIEDDITVYAQWQRVEKYAVTYIANGATGKVPTETEKYETAKFSVKGQGSLEYADHIFRGWSDGENTYQEGDEYTMPNHAVEFTAQWESTLDTHWALVISLEQLQDGDKVIIAAANSDKALGAESDNNQYRQQVDVKKSADKFYLSALQTVPTELTLGIVNGKYTFNDGDGYLAAVSSSNNYLNIEDEVSDASTWNVTITDGVASIVAQDDELRNVMSHNSGAARFSCYIGIQGQGTLAIYKYYEDRPTYYTRENLSKGKIGTICMENNILAAANATIYMPDYKDATIKNVYFVEATTELANPGMPFIFQAEQDGRMILVLGSETAEAPVSNLDQTRGMVGSFIDNVLVAPYAEDGPHNYFFSSNKLWKVGENVYVDKNRAYMNMDYVPYQEGAIQDEPSAAPRRRLSMVNADANQGDVITGLGDVLKADNVQKLIINDKMYILRAGKMYDATGRFVK